MKEEPKQSLKPTTAIDFFGSTSVKQTGKVSTLAKTKVGIGLGLFLPR